MILIFSQCRFMGFLTQDEQQFLGSSQRKHWDQTAAFSVDNIMDRVAETSFSLLPLLMNVGAVC